MLKLRQALSAILGLLILLGPHGATADPSALGDPADATNPGATGVFRTGPSTQAQPDARTGALTYTYAFDLPAARGAPQPELTLTYSSSTRDREAGYGWGSMSRPSSATRCQVTHGLMGPLVTSDSPSAANHSFEFARSLALTVPRARRIQTGQMDGTTIACRRNICSRGSIQAGTGGGGGFSSKVGRASNSDRLTRPTRASNISMVTQALASAPQCRCRAYFGQCTG
jgi:hypothetical protein